MPRRRVNNQEPPRKRSRNGCDKCRLRKVRCDEARPTCAQCSDKGYICRTTISLKWESDYIGRAFGRTGVWTKKNTKAGPSSPVFRTTTDNVPWRAVPFISPYSFINATTSNIEELLSLDEAGFEPLTSTDTHLKHDNDDTTSRASLSPWLTRRQPVVATEALPISLSPMPYFENQTYSILLAYYTERLCPLTVPSAVRKSPLASLLLPFAISSSPNTLHSLLALAACHRSKEDISFKAMALQLADNVIRSLRLRLAREDPLEVAMDTETLVIMMLLCQFEIINESDKKWVVHLKGARDLIRVRRRALPALGRPSPKNDLVAFTEKFFAFQDVIGRTACGEEPNFGPDFWTAQESETDIWLGCSSDLVAIISNITELSRQRHCKPSIASTMNFQAKAAALETKLTGLEQKVFDENDDILQTSAELKRLAAELYLHTALYGATPSTALVRVHVQQIIRLISALLEHGVMAGLTWPLFVAAVELDPTEDLEWTVADGTNQSVLHHARPFVLYALDRMSISIANISRTRSVIEKVWHGRELNQILDSQSAKVNINDYNDWERFIAPLCGNMSLA